MADNKRRMVSRRSVFKGGGSPTVNTLRARIQERNEKENTEKLRKAKKRLDQAKNKHRNQLLALGIQARKNNKARAARFQEVKARNGLPAIEDIMPPDREPDKNPTLAEALLLTDKGYKGLV